jgi:hypothetical protein
MLQHYLFPTMQFHRQECRRRNPLVRIMNETGGMGGFVPRGASGRAVARKEASYCVILRAQPPSVQYSSFAFESLGDVHEDTVGLLVQLQGGGEGVNLSV